MTSIKVNPHSADEIAKTPSVKSWAQAVDTALPEAVSLRRFKDLMRRHAGKLSFERHAD